MSFSKQICFQYQLPVVIHYTGCADVINTSLKVLFKLPAMGTFSSFLESSGSPLGFSTDLGRTFTIVTSLTNGLLTTWNYKTVTKSVKFVGYRQLMRSKNLSVDNIFKEGLRCLNLTWWTCYRCISLHRNGIASLKLLSVFLIDHCFCFNNPLTLGKMCCPGRYGIQS